MQCTPISGIIYKHTDSSLDCPMFYLGMAGLNVAIYNQFEFIQKKCTNYIVDLPEHVNFEIAPTNQVRNFFKEDFKEQWNLIINEEQAEERAVYFRLYSSLPSFDRFWIHACLVSLDGEGYAFSAPSGTGKTTHSRLWLREFGRRAQIVNGDLPVISQKDGTYYGWGTPFCGKEHYQVNTSVPLRGLAFIERGDTNKIEPLSPAEAFGYMVNDHRTWMGPKNQEHYLDLLQRFAETIPLYRLTANMEPEAAHVAYEGMSQGAQAH